MRAVVAHGPGSINKLRIEEVDRPVVPKDGVLVRVHASSVNPVDLYTLTPVAHLQRALKPAVMGTDISGTVETVGPAVTRFKAGDEVFGGARGAFAEFAGARDRNLAHKPAGDPFENAGTLAGVGCAGPYGEGGRGAGSRRPPGVDITWPR